MLVIQREPVVHVYAAGTSLSSHWKPCKDDNSVFLEIQGKMCPCGQHSFPLAAEGRKEVIRSSYQSDAQEVRLALMT